MTSAVAELTTPELARNMSGTHEHDRCGQTADENTDFCNGETSKGERETSEADMTPDTRCKADVMDDKKVETHSLLVAVDDAPRRVTDTDTKSSSGEDGETVRVRASNAPPGSLRINRSCAVTREDPYLRNVPTTSETEHNPTEGKNAEIQRARNYLPRAGGEEETQLRSPATAAFASSLIKYLEAL
eukprot:3040361-Pleurochrysis_carterae.AAC.1